MPAPHRTLGATTGLLLCAAVVSLSRPGACEEPVRPERHDPAALPPDGTGTKLVLVGAATTTAWYGASVGLSYLWPEQRGAADLRIPVAGPWMALAQTGCPEEDPNCSTFGLVLSGMLNVISGVCQAGGVLVMAEGLFLPEASAETDTKPRQATSVSAVSVAAGPMGAKAWGIAIGGRF
jgi:hypothetical protein